MIAAQLLERYKLEKKKKKKNRGLGIREGDGGVT